MKYLSTILIFLIFSFALFLQFQARTLKHLVDWGHYNSDSQPRQINNNWMSRLSDNLYIGSMSIPGTHDSGTWPGRGGDAYQCQSWNIYYQLKAGIRFLDIRIGYDDPKKLNIYHSNAFQGDLQVALNDIIRFLRQNPKEFIMMLVAHEWGPFILQNNQKRLQQLFKKLNFPYYYSEGIPRLGLVRGKVWILKNTASFPLSMKTFQFINDKTNFNPLNPYYYLQNNWEASVDQKVKYSKQLIQRTCQPLKLKINFLNIAFSFFGFPYTYAKKDGGTNESIQKFLKNWRGCVGILIMDFPGTNLIRLIINNN